MNAHYMPVLAVMSTLLDLRRLRKTKTQQDALESYIPGQISSITHGPGAHGMRALIACQNIRQTGQLTGQLQNIIFGEQQCEMG